MVRRHISSHMGSPVGNRGWEIPHALVYTSTYVAFGDRILSLMRVAELRLPALNRVHGNIASSRIRFAYE